jgi:hypothetical protein
MVSHLGEAGMQDELFGHAQAALLAGCSPSELVSAAGAGFRAAAEAAEAAAAGAGAGTEEAEEAGDAAAVPPPPGRGRDPGARSRASYRATMATLEAAWARHRERFPEAAAAVKERERRKVEEGGGGGGGGGDKEGGGDRESGNTSSSPTSLSSSSPSPSSLLPQILVAGHDDAWWNRVPELDLEDFSLGCERAPRGKGKRSR